MTAGAPSKKMGRPRRSGELADRTLTIRLTPSEEQAWLKVAGRRPLREWVRELVNDRVAEVEAILQQFETSEKK